VDRAIDARIADHADDVQVRRGGLAVGQVGAREVVDNVEGGIVGVVNGDARRRRGLGRHKGAEGGGLADRRTQGAGGDVRVAGDRRAVERDHAAHVGRDGQVLDAQVVRAVVDDVDLGVAGTFQIAAAAANQVIRIDAQGADARDDVRYRDDDGG